MSKCTFFINICLTLLCKIYLHPVLSMYVLMFVIPFALTPKTLKTIKLCSMAITRVEIRIAIVKASVYAQVHLAVGCKGTNRRACCESNNHSLSTAVGFHT